MSFAYNAIGLIRRHGVHRYNWKDDHTLELIIRYIESPHTMTILCYFGGDEMTAEIHNSFDKENKLMILNGKR
jgi:hypothetical protein